MLAWRSAGRLAWLVAACVSLGAAPAADGQPERNALAIRGEQIAFGGGPGGPSSACFQCHGLAGEGQGGSGYPRLAGLSPAYLGKQLDDFATGSRRSAIMAPIARLLAAADRRAVALYYGQLSPAGALSPPHTDALKLQAGAALYAVGAPDRGLQPCRSCHGPYARGMGADFPALWGQPHAYISRELHRWRSGARRNDAADIMGAIAAKMSDDEIAAVAAYLAALHAPSPATGEGDPEPGEEPAP